MWIPPQLNSIEESFYLQGIKAKIELTGLLDADFIANMDTTSLDAFDTYVRYGFSYHEDESWREVFTYIGWDADWNNDEIHFIDWAWAVRLSPNEENNDELIRVDGHNNNFPPLNETEIPKLIPGCTAPAA